MSNFSLPSVIIRKIDKAHRVFLWSGEEWYKSGRSLLNWSTICQPKQFGGLGITNLKTLNQTLLCKWWWNLFTNDKKPWSAVIKTNYYRDRPVSLKPLIRKNLSEFWKQVYSVKDIFQSMVKFQVGTGSQLSFWDDTLSLDQPTKKRFPWLFCISPSKEASVAEAYRLITRNGQWNFPATLTDPLEQQMLSQELTSVEL